MNYWHSLAGRLFKLVFTAYILLAVFVTLVQLGIEYSAIQRLIGHDLASLGDSFAGGVTEAMWELDREMMKTMAQGISQSSIVTGVIIAAPNGKPYASVGDVHESEPLAAPNIFAPFQFNHRTLSKPTAHGVRQLGSVTIYANRSVAIGRVKYSFIVILVNSIVKTAGLWFIFYIVITKWLSRPLSEMTTIVSQIQFASESNTMVPLRYPHEDELGSLADSMNKMQERLFSAHNELELMNIHLEKTVEERTRRLSEALRFNETILLSSPLPMGVYTESGDCVLANTAYAQLLGMPIEDVLEINFYALKSLQIPDLHACFEQTLRCRCLQSVEISMDIARNRSLWLECRILPTSTTSGDHLLVQFIDLTERKRVEEDLRHHAFHDPLTHLPNRRMFLDRLQLAIHTTQRQHGHGAVLFLDLNKFKQLNDTHGHDVGDMLLVEVANRLRKLVRSSDTIARLGGDEFVVLLEGLGERPEQAERYARAVAGAIRAELSAEYILGEIHHSGSASVGITIFDGNAEDPDSILKLADEAMYQIKKGVSSR